MALEVYIMQITLIFNNMIMVVVVAAAVVSVLVVVVVCVCEHMCACSSVYVYECIHACMSEDNFVSLFSPSTLGPRYRT